MKPRVIITGVTGLIGSELALSLVAAGYDVVGLSRNPSAHPRMRDAGVRLVQWNASDPDSWYREAEGALAIINLAGENIAGGRWTRIRKELMLQSRVDAILQIQRALNRLTTPPELLIQGSATGYYGHQPGVSLDEGSGAGEGFLADICKTTEQEARQTQNIQVVMIRTGIVLSDKGGALPKLTASMRLGIGGYPGKGQQMVPWIHIEDEIRAILHILTLKKEDREALYNLTSPEPVSMKSMVIKAARCKRALITLPIPVGILHLMLGKQMVQETLQTDQAVNPAALIRSGFKFRHPEIRQTLNHLLA
jgi:uncharacterized protein